VYSFSHLTLQEFLTARYIAQSSERIENLVTQHLHDERWREVFILVAGSLDSADVLISLMEKEAKKCLNPKLIRLLNWANQSTLNSESDYKPAAKRIAALARKLQEVKIFKPQINFKRLIANLQDLQSEIPPEDALKNIRIAFIERITQLWWETLQIDPDWLTLTEAESTALNDYLKAHQLIFECKKAAVRISRRTWEALEERMFLVEPDRID